MFSTLVVAVASTSSSSSYSFARLQPSADDDCVRMLCAFALCRLLMRAASVCGCLVFQLSHVHRVFFCIFSAVLTNWHSNRTAVDAKVRIKKKIEHEGKLHRRLPLPHRFPTQQMCLSWSSASIFSLQFFTENRNTHTNAHTYGNEMKWAKLRRWAMRKRSSANTIRSLPTMTIVWYVCVGFAFFPAVLTDVETFYFVVRSIFYFYFSEYRRCTRFVRSFERRQILFMCVRCRFKTKMKRKSVHEMNWWINEAKRTSTSMRRMWRKKAKRSTSTDNDVAFGTQTRDTWNAYTIFR